MRSAAHFQVTNIATVAAVITTTVIQPSTESHREFVRAPMTFRLFVSSSTITIRGGASTPFRTADQNSIDTALKPA